MQTVQPANSPEARDPRSPLKPKKDKPKPTEARPTKDRPLRDPSHKKHGVRSSEDQRQATRALSSKQTAA